MLRKLLAICALAFAMISFAKAPDFAYPATVSKTAVADLDKAVKSHQIVPAIDALIRYYVSEKLIEPDSIQCSIRKAEQVAAVFKDDKAYGLFPALIADMYASAYSRKSYIYQARKAPLLPLPQDITEWTADQYLYKVEQLCRESYTLPAMTDCQIKDYADIITLDKYSADYYPTLRDFAAANAVCAFRRLNDSKSCDELCREALGWSTPGTPESFVWMTYCLKPAETLDAFRKYAGDPYASVLLDSYGETLDISYTDIDKCSEFCRVADDFVTRFPDAPYTSNLKQKTQMLRRPDVSLHTEQYVALGNDLSLHIRNENESAAEFKIYRVSPDIDRTVTYNFAKTDAALLNKKNLVQTLRLTSDAARPFVQDTVLKVSLPYPGTYAIVPSISEKNAVESDFAVFYCLEAYPVGVSELDNGYVVLVNSADGSAISGVKLAIGTDGKSQATAVTDKDGFATIDPDLDQTYKTRLRYSYNGTNYLFNGQWGEISRYIGNVSKVNYIKIFTDRPIYHPGEKMQVMAVAEFVENPDDKTGILCVGKQVRMTLTDPNGQEVATETATTDAFGRATATFQFPESGLTGRFTIRANVVDNDGKFDYYGGESKLVMVSDYKLPDFEVVMDPVQNDVPGEGEVTVTGRVITYSGMPLAAADVEVAVSEGSMARWWQESFDKFCTLRTKTDAEGRFSVVVTKDDFNKRDNNRNSFKADIDVTDASGATVSAAQYFVRGSFYTVKFMLNQRNIDGSKPFKPEVTVVDAFDKSVDIPLKWKLVDSKNDVVAASGDFRGTLDLSAVRPGNYYLGFEAIATDVDAESAGSDVVIYNPSTDIIPGDVVLWSLHDNAAMEVEHTAKTAGILYGTALPEANVYYFVYSGKVILKKGNMKVKQGYHNLKIDIPAEYDNVCLKLFTVHQCTVSQIGVSVNRKRDDALVIKCETFRDKLVPQSVETWKFSISPPAPADRSPYGSALFLDMYNKSLETLQKGSYNLGFYHASADNLLRLNYIYNYTQYAGISAKLPDIKTFSLLAPAFNFYNTVGGGALKVRGLAMSKSSNLMYSAMPTYDTAGGAYEEAAVDYAAAEKVEAVVVECKADDAGDAGDPAPEDRTFSYRDAEVPLAIWAPDLTTDAEGNLSYTFTVPDANTTWLLHALAWDNDMRVGSLVREFVASKPLMVQPNLPRFLRTGDSTVISAIVMNNSDQAQAVETTIEFFNPFSSEVFDTQVFVNDVDSMGSVVVSVPLSVKAGIDAIGYRIKSEGDNFSDGEQAVIRILPSDTKVYESYPFYLNPGDTDYAMTLPSQPDARLSLSFCENPVWTVVSALPGMRENIDNYANSAAAALFSTQIARGIINDNPEIASVIRAWLENPTDSALVSALQKNEDLKIALLNATPWVQAAQSQTDRMGRLALIFDNKELDGASDKAIAVLDKLQRNDGGWAWGEWCDESSPWITMNVLDMFATLRRFGWMPTSAKVDKMIPKALRYLDKKVEDTDMMYALLRPQFPEVSVSSNGRKVIDATVTDISKHWKTYSDPAYKSLAAELLWNNGKRTLARELMRSVAEFGKWSKDQGLRFPSVNSLSSYATVLEAFALIEPSNRAVDGLRQQLIVRKQAVDWGSSVVTNEVVAAILSSGSKWTVPAQGATVLVNDSVVSPRSAVETATGQFVADLTGNADGSLVIHTSGAGPAYGAVFAQYEAVMADVEAFGCDDLEIEKRMWRRDGLGWSEIDSLTVGDRVRVQLTIHAKRNMNFVEIIDERAAAFQPVDQLPGYIWSEGVGFYRENRDSYTALHVGYMRPGTYQLTYELNVALPGTFSSGIATIQSLQAPDLTAHSSGTIIRIK